VGWTLDNGQMLSRMKTDELRRLHEEVARRLYEIWLSSPEEFCATSELALTFASLREKIGLELARRQTHRRGIRLSEPPPEYPN
jgi:hypothetical protein